MRGQTAGRASGARVRAQGARRRVAGDPPARGRAVGGTRAPHATTESIIGLVRADLGEVSHQAVYDVLQALTAAGLLRRIQPKGSVARYESRVGDKHHHVVCRSCGVVADVDCAVGQTPCLTAADTAGYQIDEVEVIYWGRCPRCANGDQPSKKTARQEEDRRA
jgi:Fur family transcriptional regulator, stress-responsive regulator